MLVDAFLVGLSQNMFLSMAELEIERWMQGCERCALDDILLDFCDKKT